MSGSLKITLVASTIYRDDPNFDTPEKTQSIALLKLWCDRRPEIACKTDIRNLYIPLKLGDVSFSEGHIEEILSTRPDVVGLSCYVWNVDAMLNLSRELKRRDGNLKIVLGGIAATASSFRILSENPAVDIIVRGEGEVPLEMMIRQNFENLHEIQGISFRENGSVREIGPPWFFRDLSQIPSAYAEGMLDIKDNYISIEISRGCPYDCAFCSRVSQTRHLRLFPIERIKREIEWARDNGVKTIFFNETNTNPASARFFEIVDAIRGIYGGREFKLCINIDVAHQTPDVIRKLAGIPFDKIMFGIQTLNPASQKAIQRRGADLEKLKSAIIAASELGMVQVDIILGLPGDDLNGFKRTVEWLGAVNREKPGAIGLIAVFWAIAIPGTPMGDRPAEFGIREIASPGIPYVIETDLFSKSDLVDAMFYLSERMEEIPVCWIDTDPIRFFPELEPLDRLFKRAYKKTEKDRRKASTGKMEIEISARVASILSLLKPELTLNEEVRDGWIFSGCSDSAEGLVLSFEREGGGLTKVMLSVRDDSKPAYYRTRNFNFSYQKIGGDPDMSFIDHIREIVAGKDGRA